jgi:hypothetical protein
LDEYTCGNAIDKVDLEVLKWANEGGRAHIWCETPARFASFFKKIKDEKKFPIIITKINLFNHEKFQN